MTPADETTTRNPLEDLLGYQVRRAWMAISADLVRSIEDLDLTITEMSMLLLIEANPQITQSDIGRELSMQRANMVPLTASLLQRDLIDREALDGRSHALMLSAKGKELTREARRRVAEHEKRFLSRLPAADRPRFLRLLGTLWTSDN